MRNREALFSFYIGIRTNRCTNEDKTQILNFGAAKYLSNPYTYICNLSCMYCMSIYLSKEVWMRNFRVTKF